MLSGCGASFCRCSVVFAFFRSLNGLLTHIYQNYFDDCVAWLKHFLTWQAERISASSILLIVRQTVASLMPYEPAIWNCVRYSRQYIKVISNWSACLNLGGQPKFGNPRLRTSSILSKISCFTPVSRLKSVSFHSSISSYLICLLWHTYARSLL